MRLELEVDWRTAVHLSILIPDRCVTLRLYVEVFITLDDDPHSHPSTHFIGRTRMHRIYVLFLSYPLFGFF